MVGVRPRMGLASPRAVHALLRAGTQRLESAGIVPARHEAEWLLSHLLDVAPLELYLDEREAPVPVVERFFARIEARAMGCPLQYLIGAAEFFGERLVVNPGVFIPRPETEAIVQAALEALRPRRRQLARPLRLLDLGTGSGCIAIALARALPACLVVGVEVSWVALRTARRNVRRSGLASQVHLVQSDWGLAIRGRFDGVISNPPYVPRARVEQLPLDVRQEPRESLDGGEDGMAALTVLLDEGARLVSPGGVVVLECGEEHVELLARRAADAAWVRAVWPIDDLAARPRGVLLYAR